MNSPMYKIGQAGWRDELVVEQQADGTYCLLRWYWVQDFEDWEIDYIAEIPEEVYEVLRRYCADDKEESLH